MSASAAELERVGQRERAERGHELRAVDEREPLLGLEHDRLETGLAQHTEAGPAHAVATDDLSLSDEHEREVRERREIARRSDRALRWHPRNDVGLEHRQQELDDLESHTRVPHRHDLRAQEDHRAHLGGPRSGPTPQAWLRTRFR
jgi:hypothetical protein